MTTFHHVFTDYPLADLPAMPNGFADSSWHNDTCPSYMHEGLEIVVYMDYADPALRECQGEGPRFTILCTDTDFTSESYSSDNWNDVLAYIIAVKWVKQIGLGFHPDTRGKDYSPRIAVAMQRDYDMDMETLFDVASDPYAAAIAAMQAYYPA